MFAAIRAWWRRGARLRSFFLFWSRAFINLILNKPFFLFRINFVHFLHFEFHFSFILVVFEFPLITLYLDSFFNNSGGAVFEIVKLSLQNLNSGSKFQDEGFATLTHVILIEPFVFMELMLHVIIVRLPFVDLWLALLVVTVKVFTLVFPEINLLFVGLTVHF